MSSIFSNGFFQLFLCCLLVYVPLMHVTQRHKKIDPNPLVLPLHHSEHPNVFLYRESFQHHNCSRSLFFVGQQKVGTQTMMKILNSIQIRHRKSYNSRDNVKKLRRDGQCTCREFGILEISDDMPWCSGCTPSFFTMFRDPLERAFSAYNYCVKVKGNDPLCAYKEPITDICEFAKMWGNYQFDRMLTVPYTFSPRKVHTYAKKWCPDCTIFRREQHRTQPEFEGQLYRSGVYTNKLMLGHYGLNDITTTQGKVHLSRVIKSLKTAYGAIGLLEKWNDTLTIFHAYTGCKEFLQSKNLRVNTVQDKPKRPIKGSSFAFPVHSMEVVKKRWQQCLPNITRHYMAADIQIYHAAQDIFELQMKYLSRMNV